MKNQILPGLKTLFMVHFVVGLVFGLMSLLFPELWAVFGWPVKDLSLFRLVGAAVLGFSFSSWWAYQAANWEQVRILVLAELVWATLGALVTLFAVVFQQWPPIVLINAVILGGFAIAFYVYYSKQESAPAPVVSAPPPKPAAKVAAKRPARPVAKRRRA